MGFLDKIKNAFYVYRVHKNAGISYSEAMVNMAEARRDMGISFKKYYDHSMWDLEENDRIGFATKSALVRYAKQLSEFTGNSVETSKKELENGKRQYGVTYKQYLCNSFFQLSMEERKVRAQELKEKEHKQEITNEKIVAQVAEKTGWAEDEARSRMDLAQEQCGAIYKNYLDYRFWELSPEEQSTYLNYGLMRKLVRKYTIEPEKTVFFQSKEMFNKTFSEFTGRKWIKTPVADPAQVDELLKESDKLIYKPKERSGARGVRVFDVNETRKEDIIKFVSELPAGVLEEYVDQHKEMAKLSGGSAVNTVRVVSVLDNSHCFIPAAVLRVAREGKAVDNLLNDGFIGALDPETGKVIKPATDRDGVHHETLPNGIRLEGFQVPYWQEIREMIDRAARVVPTVGFVGWDVAVMEDGPVLIEGNTHPASNILQLPFVEDREGRRHIFDRFFK